MTLGQMRTLTQFTNERIDSYAGNNPSFDRDKAIWRVDLNVEEGEQIHGLTPFAFKLLNEGYTVLLNEDNEIAHVHRFSVR